jgi:hypothetical protein
METLTVADEIPDANVVRLWHDPVGGQWHGLLGPNDGRGLTASGGSASLTLLMLAGYAIQYRWPFDPTAPGPVIDSGVVR